MNAWISPSFCRLPVDSWRMGRSRSASKRSANESRRRGSTPPRSRAEIIEHDPPGQLWVHGQITGKETHPAADLDAVSCRTSSPRMRAEPAVGLIRSNRSRIVVDLPAPLGPRKPNTSPCWTSRSSSNSPRPEPVVLRQTARSRSRALRSPRPPGAAAAHAPDCRRQR